MRVAPPGAAARGQRAATFRASLEQAEQQFAVALDVGSASKALNLFYGLSQAGRAVAAAANTLGSDEWRLRGHGLRSSELEELQPSLNDVSIGGQGGDATSFARVSRAIGSPQLTRQVPLEAVWPQLLETTYHASYGDTYYSTMPVMLSFSYSGISGVDKGEVCLPPDLSNTPADERPLLTDFLNRYPTLAGSVQTTPITWHPGGFDPVLRWPSVDVFENPFVDRQLAYYRGCRVAVPVIGELSEPFHPLMAWWLVLYALSMMTRYEPAAWTKLIDVNQSAHATVVEFVLELAGAAVPDLLAESLGSLANESRP